MSQETAAAFFITLPVVGECPTGTIPVSRVFSNRADANHRYMIDRTVRTQMASMGWTIEGDGADFVVMCAPPGAGSPGVGVPAPPPPCTPIYGRECPP